jgi:tRNA-specific 2-thiouridylase
MKIALGISGGVDSAVAAYLCRKLGNEVIGVFMKIWDESRIPPDNHSGKSTCFGPEEKHDLDDARKICDHLGIALHVFDCSKQFNRDILRYFSDTYRRGKTPNPCVFCNTKMKFGLLPQLLEKSNIPFDAFATGHYARVDRDASGKAHLKRTLEDWKDQSYFLYRLTRDQIERALFPLGELSKKEVRAIAKEAGLHVWDKMESQDFYSGDYRELLGNTGDTALGTIVTTDGIIVGRHEGIWNYTVGQRAGLGAIRQRPMYVVKILPENNQIVVGEPENLIQGTMKVSQLNLLEAIPATASCKIRSSSPMYPCVVRHVAPDELEIVFDEPVAIVSPGQSAVIYDGDIVVGGGVITGSN